MPSPPMYDDHEYDVERFKRRLVNTDTASNVTKKKPHRSMDLEDNHNDNIYHVCRGHRQYFVLRELSKCTYT